MPKETRIKSCKCGQTDHQYTNHPLCRLRPNKTPRNKPQQCHACKATDHTRISSKLCPLNKVIIIEIFIFSIIKYTVCFYSISFQFSQQLAKPTDVKIEKSPVNQYPMTTLNNPNTYASNQFSMVNNYHISKTYILNLLLFN